MTRCGECEHCFGSGKNVATAALTDCDTRGPCPHCDGTGSGMPQADHKHDGGDHKQRGPRPFTIGDRVAYSVQFLKSVGLAHGAVAHARGTVIAVDAVNPQWTLVTVEWDRNVRELPRQVHAGNLAHVGLNTRFASC